MGYNELLNSIVRSSWLKLISCVWWKNKSHMRSTAISDKWLSHGSENLWQVPCWRTKDGFSNQKLGSTNLAVYKMTNHWWFPINDQSYWEKRKPRKYESNLSFIKKKKLVGPSSWLKSWKRQYFIWKNQIWTSNIRHFEEVVHQ